MENGTTNPYLRTKVMTASPQQLRLMLFDGAVKFCRQARRALAQRDFEGMYHALVRAQKIILELSTGLRRDLAPDLCDKLASLYNYIYLRLVDAAMERDEAAIDECLRLIEYERETWALAIRRSETGAADDPSAHGIGTGQPGSPGPLAHIGPRGAGYAPAADGSPRFSAEG